MIDYHLNHLKELESESIFVLREVAAQFENPCILFYHCVEFNNSGSKKQ